MKRKLSDISKNNNEITKNNNYSQKLINYLIELDKVNPANFEAYEKINNKIEQFIDESYKNINFAYQDQHGNTVCHYVTKFNLETILTKIIKLSPELVGKALTIDNIEGKLPLDLARESQNGVVRLLNNMQNQKEDFEEFTIFEANSLDSSKDLGNTSTKVSIHDVKIEQSLLEAQIDLIKKLYIIIHEDDDASSAKHIEREINEFLNLYGIQNLDLNIKTIDDLTLLEIVMFSRNNPAKDILLQYIDKANISTKQLSEDGMVFDGKSADIHTTKTYNLISNDPPKIKEIRPYKRQKTTDQAQSKASITEEAQQQENQWEIIDSADENEGELEQYINLKSPSNTSNNDKNVEIDKLGKELIQIVNQQANTNSNKKSFDKLASTIKKEVRKWIKKAKNQFKEDHDSFEKAINYACKEEYNNTALHIAAYKHLVNIDKILIEYGANPLMKNIEGDTALHFKALWLSTNISINKLTKKYGGSDIKNNEGKIPLNVKGNLADKCKNSLTPIKEVAMNEYERNYQNGSMKSTANANEQERIDIQNKNFTEISKHVEEKQIKEQTETEDKNLSEINAGQIERNIDNNTVSYNSFSLFDSNCYFPEQQTINNINENDNQKDIEKFGKKLIEIITQKPCYQGDGDKRTNKNIGNIVKRQLEKWINNAKEVFDNDQVSFEKAINYISNENHGNTAMHIAMFLNLQRVVLMLSQNGANPAIQNNDGDTVAHIASSSVGSEKTLDIMTKNFCFSDCLNIENNKKQIPDTILSTEYIKRQSDNVKNNESKKNKKEYVYENYAKKYQSPKQSNHDEDKNPQQTDDSIIVENEEVTNKPVALIDLNAENEVDNTTNINLSFFSQENTTSANEGSADSHSHILLIGNVNEQ